MCNVGKTSHVSPYGAEALSSKNAVPTVTIAKCEEKPDSFEKAPNAGEAKKAVGILAGVGATIAGGVAAFKNKAKIGSFLKPVWNGIKGFATKAFSVIGSFAGKIGSFLKNLFAKKAV